MATFDWLEVGKLFVSIVAVWFALVGWKLVSPAEADQRD